MIKLKGLESVKHLLGTKAYTKATNRTIREIGRGVKARTTKDVRTTYNVRAGYLKHHLKVKTQKRVDDTIEWEMRVRGRQINLIHFGARQLKRGGVSFKVKRQGGRQRLRHAFIAKGRGGKLLVFQRKGRARYPLDTKYSLSVAQMYNEEIVNRRLREAEERYPLLFLTNLRYYLEK